MAETLVAITILTLSITFGVSVAADSFFYTGYSKDELTASYLAQEGLEAMRAKRDGNILAGSAWDLGFNECTTPAGCVIDGYDPNLTTFDCSTGVPDCGKVYRNGDEDKQFFYSLPGASYAPASPEDTKFTRIVMVTSIANEVIVSSVVRWKTKGGTDRIIDLRQTLTDWGS